MLDKVSSLRGIETKEHYMYIITGELKHPLGKRQIGLKVGRYNGTVYGTNNESSIGKNISGGCIRMHNSEVEWLFNLVSYGA